MEFDKLNNEIAIDNPAREKIIPNTIDGAYKKHVPIIEHHSDTVLVKVGSVAYPMLDVHYIEWIILETTAGIRRKN